MNTNIIYQINRSTSVLHKEVVSEKFELSEFPSLPSLKKFVLKCAQRYSDAGYNVTVTKKENDKWSIVKIFSGVPNRSSKGFRPNFPKR